jgi:ketosteroid isomerase-like protein
MNETNNPTATVQRMFATFSAADVDALLETVHPDSRWIYYGTNPRTTNAHAAAAAKTCLGS